MVNIIYLFASFYNKIGWNLYAEITSGRFTSVALSDMSIGESLSKIRGRDGDAAHNRLI